MEGVTVLETRCSVSLGGTRVDLWQRQEVLAAVRERLRQPYGPPLYIGSANLDHIAHFGPAGRSVGLVDFEADGCQWLVLVDGVPLLWRSRWLVQEPVEQLAGSDLLGDLVTEAARTGSRFGVVGGTPETHDALRGVLQRQVPDLAVAGLWSPAREELQDPVRARDLAEQIAAAEVHLLLVALGKPRQEHFLAVHGAVTGARVALAFGAAVDFLAGRARRAPVRMRRAGLEWLWRLAQEPGRLSHRYLVEGPPNLVSLVRDARVLVTDESLPTVPATAMVPAPRASAGELQTAHLPERRLADRRRAPVQVPQQRRPERRQRQDRRAATATRRATSTVDDRS